VAEEPKKCPPDLVDMKKGWSYGEGESFSATLKRELVVLENFLTSEETKAIIFEYIEVLYNRPSHI
jgi:transposase InsO family protein